jgi:hypothetical protein
MMPQQRERQRDLIRQYRETWCASSGWERREHNRKPGAGRVNRQLRNKHCRHRSRQAARSLVLSYPGRAVSD